MKHEHHYHASKHHQAAAFHNDIAHKAHQDGDNQKAAHHHKMAHGHALLAFDFYELATIHYTRLHSNLHPNNIKNQNNKIIFF
jgi:plasmid stabilization system protein ParE